MQVANVAGIVVLAVILMQAPELPRPATALIIAILLGIYWLMGGLSVTVTERSVTAAFGPGLIRRTITLDRIESVKTVRNSWLTGWGIRLIPSGWMFNVSGRDAVELKLQGGGSFRIGTDEPQQLEAAVRQALAAVR